LIVNNGDLTFFAQSKNIFNIMYSFQLLCLIAAISQSYAQAPADDVPDDAKSLSTDCQDSLFMAGVTAAFKKSPKYSDKYDVELKLSATPKDLADVIASLKDVTPSLKYDVDYDRGFIAKLTYAQVCALDKDPRVRLEVTQSLNNVDESHRLDLSPSVEKLPTAQGLHQKHWSFLNLQRQKD